MPSNFQTIIFHELRRLIHEIDQNNEDLIHVLIEYIVRSHERRDNQFEELPHVFTRVIHVVQQLGQARKSFLHTAALRTVTLSVNHGFVDRFDKMALKLRV